MAERKKVTDPALLDALNGGNQPVATRQKVTDPALLAALNGAGAPDPVDRASTQDPANELGIPVFNRPLYGDERKPFEPTTWDRVKDAASKSWVNQLIVKPVDNFRQLASDVYEGKADPLSDSSIDIANQAAGILTPTAPARLLPLATGAAIPKKAPMADPATDVAAASVNPVVAAGERQGVPVARYIASERKSVNMLAQAARQAPLSGARIESAAQAFRGGVADAADRAVQSLGSGDAMKAGEGVRAGLAKEVGGLQSRSGAMYDKVDAIVDPNIATPLNATRKAVEQISARRAAMAANGESLAIREVDGAIGRDGGLTYHGIKDLRTAIGEKLKPGMLPQGMSQGELKAIYGALSDDLATAAKNAGGDAGARAWRQANTFFQAARGRQEKLAKIIGSEGDATGEKVFGRLSAMASSTSSADLRTLNLAKRSLDTAEWNELVSGVVARMGRTSPEAEFSPDKFVTQWTKLSAGGRATLFGGNKELQQALDDIVLLSTKNKAVEKFANHSNTGRAAGLAAFAAGSFVSPLTAIKIAIGGEMLARVLAKPVTAKAAAKWAKEVTAAQSAKPTPGAAKMAEQASLRLGTMLASQFGVPANDTTRALIGSLRAAAEQQNNENN